MADTALAHRLSQSRYLAGLQCHKQLWWRVHEPDALELVPDVALRNRFAQGAEVDQRARGYVPGGELIDLPFYEFDNKVAGTRDAIRHDPPVLYQPWLPAGQATHLPVDRVRNKGAADPRRHPPRPAGPYPPRFPPG